MAKFIRKEFNATTVTPEQLVELLKGTAGKISDTNYSVQESVYASLYTAISAYNKTPLQQAFKTLCNVDGFFDEGRYKMVKVWVERFFDKASRKDLITGKDVYKFTVQQADFAFDAEVLLSDVMVFKEGEDGEKKEVRKVLLPRKGTEEFEALAAFLREYAEDHFVMNSVNELRKELDEKAVADGKLTANQKAAEKEKEKELLAAGDDSLTDDQKAAKEQLIVKNAEKARKGILKNLENTPKAAHTAADMLELINAMEKQLSYLKGEYAKKAAEAVGNAA